MPTATKTRRTSTTRKAPAKPAMSQEEKDSKLAEAHAMMAKGVEAIRSSDDWKRWLDFGTKFHKYSFNNVFLMMLQADVRGMAPLTRVAGFRKWQELNRQVRKGEQGLKIFAPVMVKIRPDEERYDPEFPNRQKLVGFRLTAVFDLQQTDGDPIPEQPTYKSQPVGEVPDGFHAALDAMGQSIGFPISFGDTGDAGGYTDPLAKVIKISDKIKGLDAQSAGTKIHEIAHALLHVGGDFNYRTHQGVAETEAESVAYMVGTYFGIDMADESFHYVAGWAPDLETVQNVGQRVMKTSKTIIEFIEGREA